MGKKSRKHKSDVASNRHVEHNSERASKRSVEPSGAHASEYEAVLQEVCARPIADEYDHLSEGAQAAMLAALKDFITQMYAHLTCHVSIST